MTLLAAPRDASLQEEAGTGAVAGDRSPRVDRLVPVAAVLLVVAFSSQTSLPMWTPKAVVALVVGLGGVASLAVLILRRDRSAVALGGLLVAGGLSMVLSDRPLLSLFGPQTFGTGWLFMLVVAGWWALGRRLSERGRRNLESALVWAAVANGAVATVEALWSLPYSGFQALEGRSAGLFDNPVYLAGFLTGAVALVVRRIARDRADRTVPWGDMAVLMILAVGLEVSGERLGLLAAGAVAVAALAGRSLRGRRVTAVACAAALAVGVLLGALADGSGGQTGGGHAGGGATTQLARTTSGNALYGRVYSWEAAVSAVGRRPLLGWGPGRYAAATTPHRSLSEARAQGPEQVFSDAHDLLVQYATTTGLVGLGFLLAFLVLAARRARGPLAWFAALIAVHLLLEPQSVGVVPLGMLALGAAAGGATEPVPVLRVGWLRPATAAGLAVGAVVAGMLYLGDVSYKSATTGFSPTAMSRAMRLLPPWPQVAQDASRIYIFEGLGTPADSAQHRAALAYARRGTDEDPSSATAWTYRGAVERKYGSTRRAAADFARALADNPYSYNAMAGVYVTAGSGDATVRTAMCRRMVAVTNNHPLCP